MALFPGLLSQITKLIEHGGELDGFRICMTKIEGDSVSPTATDTGGFDSTVTRVGEGFYTLTLASAFNSTDEMFVFATYISPGGGDIGSVTVTVVDTSTIQIAMYDLDGAALADADCFVCVIGQ